MFFQFQLFLFLLWRESCGHYVHMICLVPVYEVCSFKSFNHQNCLVLKNGNSPAVQNVLEKQ